MTHVDLLGHPVVCPSCRRVTEADLFRNEPGALRCAQCATRPRRRGSALIPLGLGRAGAGSVARKPGTREAP